VCTSASRQTASRGRGVQLPLGWEPACSSCQRLPGFVGPLASSGLIRAPLMSLQGEPLRARGTSPDHRCPRRRTQPGRATRQSIDRCVIYHQQGAACTCSSGAVLTHQASERAARQTAGQHPTITRLTADCAHLAGAANQLATVWHRVLCTVYSPECRTLSLMCITSQSHKQQLTM
jgi:hypothetical protein